MPAKDRYHDTVVHALRKDGWTITGEQIVVILGERHLWIDIEAAKAADHLTILIEVKGFERMPSPVASLASAVGQYVLYRAALDHAEVTTPLFLAVPSSAYEGILSEELGQHLLAHVGVALLVFDPSTEEIVRWNR